MYQNVEIYLRYWYKSKKNVSPHRTRSLTSDTLYFSHIFTHSSNSHITSILRYGISKLLHKIESAIQLILRLNSVQPVLLLHSTSQLYFLLTADYSSPAQLLSDSNPSTPPVWLFASDRLHTMHPHNEQLHRFWY
jgi:hypothetical protein